MGKAQVMVSVMERGWGYPFQNGQDRHHRPRQGRALAGAIESGTWRTHGQMFDDDLK